MGQLIVESGFKHKTPIAKQRRSYKFVDALPLDAIEFSKDYFVCPDGKIYSTAFKKKTGIILVNQRNNGKGYMRVDVYGKTMYVHRIVASTFLPNPYNSPEVNHLDGNKANNSVMNLEWCTAHQNRKHAYRHGLITREHLAAMGRKGGKQTSENRKARLGIK